MSHASQGKAVLDAYASRINPLLAAFFRQQIRRLDGLPSAQSAVMFDQLRRFCKAGGKRLRPALVYWGFRLLGGEDGDDILKASLVVEILHAYLLIHDDVMDQSALRRGKPTVHHAYAKRSQRDNPGTDPQHHSRQTRSQS